MVRQPPAAAARQLATVLHDIAWLVPRKLDPQAELGLEHLPQSELEVMRLLVRVPGLSVGSVARELGLQQSNASAAIRGLLARGLLEREKRRSRRTRLQAGSYRRAQAIRRQREEAWGKLLGSRLAHLSTEDIEKLLSATDSLSALAAELGDA